MAPSDNAEKKPLKEVAQDKLSKNPSALGDPVSLRAEKSTTEPTEKDRPNKEPSKEKSLKEIAQDKLKDNPSQLGDPVSLKAETADSHPTEQDRGATDVDPNAGKSGKSKL